MFGYVIDVFKGLGATIADKDVGFFKDIVARSMADRAYIEGLFGPLTKDKDILSRIKTTKISAALFDNLVDILDFCRLIKKAFPKLPTAIISFASPSNIIFSTLFARLGNNYKDFLFSIDGSKLNKQFVLRFFDPKSRQYKELKRVFKIFKLAASENVIKLPRHYKDYLNSEFVNHELIFAVASTAGFPYYFSTKSPDSRSLDRSELSVLPIAHKLTHDDPFEAVYLRGPMFFGISHNDKRDSSVINFLSWYGNTKT